MTFPLFYKATNSRYFFLCQWPGSCHGNHNLGTSNGPKKIICLKMLCFCFYVTPFILCIPVFHFLAWYLILWRVKFQANDVINDVIALSMTLSLFCTYEIYIMLGIDRTEILCWFWILWITFNDYFVLLMCYLLNFIDFQMHYMVTNNWNNKYPSNSDILLHF